MTDIQAAVGREQLKRLPEIIGRRRLLAQRYSKLLADISELKLPAEPCWARSNWQSYCIRLQDSSAQLPVMQAMLDAGVATRRGIMCAHREPAYQHEPWSCGKGPVTCDCPNSTCIRLIQSEQAQETGIILPLYHQMTEREQDRVVTVLRHALRS
jgi:dTDP-4-amino-4,6-dideoxygalactose transaminase